MSENFKETFSLKGEQILNKIKELIEEVEKTLIQRLSH